MKAIQKALKSIISFFEMVIDFVTSIVNGMVDLVMYIGDALSAFSDIVLSLPTWLQAFALIVSGVSVTYLIVGRSGGKSE